MEGALTEVRERQNELEAFYKEEFPNEESVSKPRAPKAKTWSNNSGDDEVIQEIQKKVYGDDLKRLFEGDWSDYPSQSEADMALCHRLAVLVAPDEELIDRLFRRSGLYRMKWEDREDYRKKTVEKAISSAKKSRRAINSEEIGAKMDNLKRETNSCRLTDLGNAKRMVSLHSKDLLYCHPWRRWLVWDGTCWRNDDRGEVEAKAKDTVRQMYGEAQAIDDTKERKKLVGHAMKSESVGRIRAMISLAHSEVGIPITPDQLDNDQWLFNFQNGTIDLRTGKIREHRRRDLITKISPVSYDAKAEALENTSQLIAEFIKHSY